MHNTMQRQFANRYKPKYFLGDRVYGKYKNIPFVGTVAIDNMVSEEVGPQVKVFLDLPIKINDTYIDMISLKPSQVKPLKEYNGIKDETKTRKSRSPRK